MRPELKIWNFTDSAKVTSGKCSQSILVSSQLFIVKLKRGMGFLIHKHVLFHDDEWKIKKYNSLIRNSSSQQPLALPGPVIYKHKKAKREERARKKNVNWMFCLCYFELRRVCFITCSFLGHLDCCSCTRVEISHLTLFFLTRLVSFVICLLRFSLLDCILLFGSHPFSCSFSLR